MRNRKKKKTTSTNNNNNTLVKYYTRNEVAKHSTEEDCWIIIKNKIYDITKFLKRHPGGSAPLRYAGIDTTKVFHKIHSPTVLQKMGNKFQVGLLNPREGVESERDDDDDDDEDLNKSIYDVQADPDGYNERTRKLSIGIAEKREFGDLMANEGEVSNIPTIVLCLYFAIMAWSYLTSIVTGCSILVVPAYYIVGMIGFYNWHRMAHSEWLHGIFMKYGLTYLAELHEIHMEHHLERYPPADFYGSAKLFAKLYPDGKPTIYSLMDLTKTTNIADGTAMESTTAKLTKKKKKKETIDRTAPAHSFLAHEWPVIVTGLMILIIGMFPPFNTSKATTFFIFIEYFFQASIMNALHMSFHVRNFHLEKYAWYRELRTLHYIHHLGDMKTNFGMINLGIDGFFHSLAVEDHRVKKKKTAKGYYQQVVHGKTDDHFPIGITKTNVLMSAQHAGMVSQMLGFDMPMDQEDSKAAKMKTKKSFPAVLLRIILTCTTMYMWWHVSNHLDAIMINKRPPNTLMDGNKNVILLSDITPNPDIGHVYLSKITKWLMEGAGAPRAVFFCALSDCIGEIMCLIVCLISLFGVSFRPMLSGMFILIISMLLKILGANTLIIPTNKISFWQETPGFLGGHFFVKPYKGYSFLSARVAYSAVVVLELLSISVYSQGEQFFGKIQAKHKTFAALLGILLLFFQAGISIALRETWTFDVIIALVIARYCGIIADRYTPWVDVFVP